MPFDGSDHMCVLHDRVCSECGECDRCDLNPEKLCDNCMKCLGLGDQTKAGFRAIRIDGLLTDDERLDDEEFIPPAV